MMLELGEDMESGNKLLNYVIIGSSENGKITNFVGAIILYQDEKGKQHRITTTTMDDTTKKLDEISGRSKEQDPIKRKEILHEVRKVYRFIDEKEAPLEWLSYLKESKQAPPQEEAKPQFKLTYQNQKGLEKLPLKKTLQRIGSVVLASGLIWAGWNLAKEEKVPTTVDISTIMAHVPKMEPAIVFNKQEHLTWPSRDQSLTENDLTYQTYYTKNNYFYQRGIEGGWKPEQCTTYVFGRVQELYDRFHLDYQPIDQITEYHNAGDWLKSHKEAYLKGETNLSWKEHVNDIHQIYPGDIVVYEQVESEYPDDPLYGHVAFVEDVDYPKGTIVLSEGNVVNQTDKNPQGYRLSTVTFDEFLSRSNNKYIDGTWILCNRRLGNPSLIHTIHKPQYQNAKTGEALTAAEIENDTSFTTSNLFPTRK